MCYRVREHRAGAAESGDASQPRGLGRLRPRWTGAIAAALMGGLAVAAIVASPSASTLSNAKQSGAPAPLAAKLVAGPTGAGVEHSSAPPAPDDEVARAAGVGHCDHDL